MDAFAGERPEVAAKRNIFTRIADFFRNIGKKRHELDFSRFSYLIADLDKKHAEYEDARTAVKLCDEAVSTISQRIAVMDRLKTVDENLRDMDCYSKISEDDAKELKELLERFRALVKDRSELKFQVTSFDPALAQISTMEDEAFAAVPGMRDAEEKQRMFKQDMNYLKGEKSELEYQREMLMKGSVYTRRFLIGVAAVFVVCTLIMGLAYIISNAQIAMPAFIMVLLVIIISSVLYGFNRRMKFELKQNYLKQQKAVGLINTKSAVFAHYTNFLNFSYKKYRVRNAEMLNNHLKDYGHYKHLTKRFDAIRKLADETEAEIQKFLQLHEIPLIMTVEKFAITFNLDEKQDAFRALQRSKSAAERDLRTLDERQETLWDELVALDKTEDGVVSGIIVSYIAEANKIMLNPAYLEDTVAEAASAVQAAKKPAKRKKVEYKVFVDNEEQAQ